MGLIKVIVRQDHRAAVSRQIHQLAESALKDVGEDCLEKSNRIIPLEEGILSDSGFVEVDAAGTGQVTGQVAYSTPYAVVQHEDTTLAHDAGRESHYLEKTVDANTREWEQHIASRLRSGL